MSEPMRVFVSPLTGRAYATKDYAEHGAGRMTARTKHDVTADVVEHLMAEAWARGWNECNAAAEGDAPPNPYRPHPTPPEREEIPMTDQDEARGQADGEQLVESDYTRTLGSLSADDIGQVVTIKDGPLNIEGVLSEVRHLTGDTSGRPITQVRLVWRDDDGEIRSGSNLSRTNGFRYEKDRGLRLPDRSDTPIRVRPEQISRPGQITPAPPRDPGQDEAAAGAEVTS